jgi:enoyl-CoA hydratase
VLSAAEEIKSKSIEIARSLGAQPGFRAVKRQIRGALAKRVAELASAGEEPFLDAFC